jgi:alpha-mannosidase
LHITDRQTNKTYPGLLQFQALADQGDSYNSAPVPDAVPYAVLFIESQVGLKGPLVGSVLVTHEISKLDLTLQTEIRLFAERARLEFTTRFISRKPNYKLQVGFLTHQPVSTVTAESHLSVVTRHYDPDFQLITHMPAEKMKELKPNTGPIQRFFSANGQSWITEGLAEYEIDGQLMWITLMRAFSHLSKADTGVRGAQAGPPFETPEGQCQGRSFVCRYAWLPEPTASEILYAHADQFYGNINAQSGKKTEKQTQCSDKSSYSLFNEHLSEVVVSACYWQPGKGLFVRLLNPQEKAVTVSLSASLNTIRTQEVNFLEEPVQILEQGNVSIQPQDVKTVWFEV